jgi:hypothetical protein
MNDAIRDDRPFRLTLPEAQALRRAAQDADRSTLGPRQRAALESALSTLEKTLDAHLKDSGKAPA